MPFSTTVMFFKTHSRGYINRHGCGIFPPSSTKYRAAAKRAQRNSQKNADSLSKHKQNPRHLRNEKKITQGSTSHQASCVISGLPSLCAGTPSSSTSSNAALARRWRSLATPYTWRPVCAICSPAAKSATSAWSGRFHALPATNNRFRVVRDSSDIDVLLMLF